jgi:hypothetical protein
LLKLPHYYFLFLLTQACETPGKPNQQLDLLAIDLFILIFQKAFYPLNFAVADVQEAGRPYLCMPILDIPISLNPG